MRKQILTILRQNQGLEVSGEDLSCQFGISRTAIAKHIKALREAGYIIEASPRRGYKLTAAPNIANAAETAAYLPADAPWQINYYDAADTTINLLRQSAESGAAAYSVIIAETQDAGQGRLDRGWYSPPGCGLYLSLLLKPPIAPQLAPQLTLLTAVAIQQALCQLGCDCRIKWPNDILTPSLRKLCGIKCEMRTDMDSIKWLIVSFGININNSEFPDDLADIISSLYLQTGKTFLRPQVAAVCLTSFYELYRTYLQQGFAPIRDQWLANAISINKTVTINNSNQRLSGIARGIDSNGYLLLDVDGQIQTIAAGDMLIEGDNA